MKNRIPEAHFFHKEIRDGFFMISCPEWDMGKATVNSWMVVGNKFAVLVDAGLECTGLRKYAEALAKKPVRLVITHGHFDHIGALNEFDDFWMHPEDFPLLKGGEGIPVVNYHGEIHPLMPEIWDLGDREIQIVELKGHTKGSLLVFDKKSKILISGDSVCRRIFYSLEKEIPITDYFDNLLKLDKLGFEYVASAHDRFLLPRNQNHYMIQVVCEGIEKEQSVWKNGAQEFFTIHVGNGADDPKYISCSLPLNKKEAICKEIREWKNRGADNV